MNHQGEASSGIPDWHGQWKVCPICKGTGRDALAEREINTRNAGRIASLTIGAGTVRKFPGAVVECDLCGGTGDIPETR